MLIEGGKFGKCPRAFGAVENEAPAGDFGITPTPMIGSKGNVINNVDVGARWAASSFEMNEHCRKGVKHHVAAVAWEIFCLMRTSVLHNNVS